ncbi:unnamed protein product [Scytosiphon promiscuus]
MEDYELDYDVQDVRLGDHVFQVTTVANDALPLEMLMNLQSRSEEISGQRLWEGSLLLCDYLVEACRNRDTGGGVGGEEGGKKPWLDLKGKSVLELGAGTGIVSMLAHRLGASPLVMTDGDDKCVIMAEKNIEENEIPNDQAFVAILRWGDRESTSTFCSDFSAWQAKRLVEMGSDEGMNAASAAGMDQAVKIGATGVLPPATQGTASLIDNGKDSRRQRPLPVGDVGDGLVKEGRTPTAAACESADRNTGMAPPLSLSPLRSFDFILAGDVLYKHCLLEPFLGTVRDMLAPGGRMLLCHVPRAGVTYEIVQQAFVDAGFSFEILNFDGKGEADLRKGSSEENQDVGGGTGVAAGRSGGSCCDTTAVGGVELCVDDARRARLYQLGSVV